MLKHHQPAANNLSREVLVHLRFNNSAVLMGPNIASIAWVFFVVHMSTVKVAHLPVV